MGEEWWGREKDVGEPERISGRERGGRGLSN
jgi:hypothetical protein